MGGLDLGVLPFTEGGGRGQENNNEPVGGGGGTTVTRTAVTCGWCKETV